jgi:type III pantothenate kinase
MLLLVDAGNSRLKWRVQDETSGILAHGTTWLNEMDALQNIWQELPEISLVHACCVAAPRIQQKVEAVCHSLWQTEPRWLKVSRQCAGVHNHYHLEQLGPDRWAAVLGARQHHKGNLLIVSAGTAITIDSLTASGDYLGGVIMPGWQLMRQSLSQQTARLPAQGGKVLAHPTETVDAISTGLCDAVLGAIERNCARLQQWQPQAVHIILAGGDAFRLAPHLHLPHHVNEHLVLEGLWVVAHQN